MSLQEQEDYQHDEGIEADDIIFQAKPSKLDTNIENTINEFSKRRNSLKSPVWDSQGKRESYRDQDSVLHYFITTNQTEGMLDRYMTSLIKSFLNDAGPIYASETPDKEAFDKYRVPEGNNDSITDYLLNLKSNIIDKATRTSASNMIGHMTTSLPYFHRPLSRLLTALHQNVVKVETASTFTALERQTIAMLHHSFYERDHTFYATFSQAPDVSLGIVCSGGTVANITAMWIARNKALCANSTNGCQGVAIVGIVKALNDYGYKGCVIIGSELMHYSFRKAVDLLGLGENGLCLIPADQDFRMRIDLLKEKIEYYQKENVLILAIVAIAGTTETGSIDPIEKIVKLASRSDIHVHVDAAWGGPLIFSPEHARKLHGIERADSITIDGHKQLYTPMGLGVLLLKCPTSAQFIRKTAGYVIRNESSDLGKFSLEGSRPANALFLHASLNLLGKEGLAVLMTRSCTLTKQMSVRLSEHPSKAFQILHSPQSNILLYRYIPSNMRHKKIQ